MPVLKESYCNKFLADKLTADVLSKLEVSLEKDSNLAIILSLGIKKDGLKKILTFLKTQFVEDYPKASEDINIVKYNITKADLALQVFNFVKSTYPHHCLKCASDYEPLSKDNSAASEVKCFACKLPAHAACIKKEDINLEQGIVFLCHGCLQQEGKNIINDTVIEVKSSAEKKKAEETQDSSTTSDSDDSDVKSERESWNVKQKKGRSRKEREKVKSNKKDQDCPLLLEGKCPYGFTGKKCEYKHRRQCDRYRNFGTKEMHVAGCHFGRKCRNLHPQLCQNAVKMKICLNEKCTYAHMKYTKRSQYSTDRDSPYGNERSNQQPTTAANSSSNTAGWRKPNMSYSAATDQRYHQDTQNKDFLEKAMDRMKSEFSTMIKQQIQMQFQKMQSTSYYETEFPSMQNQTQW